MVSRTWLVFAALFASSAWAQDAKPSFDLRGDTMKKIVRATAASQAGVIQTLAESPVRHEPAAVASATVKFVTEQTLPAPVRRFATPQTPTPAPPSGGLLGDILNELVEAWLDDGYSSLTPSQYDDLWLSCQQTNDLLSTTDRYLACEERKAVQKILSP
jgi:hypothetical protein